MKNLLLTFLSVITFNCASNPVTGGSDFAGIYSVTVEQDLLALNDDTYILTMSMGMTGRMNTRMIRDRIKYECIQIMGEKGYKGYLVVSEYDVMPPLGIYKRVCEIRFFKTEEEWDKWNSRLKN